jgi:hypothetical protein
MWLAMWLKGERSGVWDSVKAALDKFAKASVVDFSVYLTDSHLAEVAFLALEQARNENLPKSQLVEIEKYARIALKNLKKYAAIFSIGIPAVNRYSGELEWHHNRREKAHQYWRKAADKAHPIPMSYEAGRTELLLGQRLPAGHPDKLAHLRKAIEVFDASGYDNWVALAKREHGLASR